MVGMGKLSRPVGMRDAPRIVEKEVITNKPEELRRFFNICDNRQLVTFQTFNRSGMREMELATLRRQDCHLDGPSPYLDVVARPEYDFIPKWYQIRSISIDPELAAMLRDWLRTHNRKLVFGTLSDRIDGHMLRTAQRIANRAGIPEKCIKLHRFRANYATWCLRRGMDLETLRAQLGHHDTESLRRCLEALKSEQRAAKVAEVFSVKLEDVITPVSAATASRVM
jgi:integrase